MTSSKYTEKLRSNLTDFTKNKEQMRSNPVDLDEMINTEKEMPSNSLKQNRRQGV